MKKKDQNIKANDGEVTFVDHLTELRYRLIKILISFTFFTITAYFFKEEIYLSLVAPLKSLDVTIIHTKVFEKFLVYFKISFYTGVIFSFPLLIYQISRFILPALYHNERKWYIASLSSVAILFFLGAILTYRFLAPISLQFLLTIGKSTDSKKIEEIKEKNKNPLPNNVQEKLLAINDKLGDINKQMKMIIQKKMNESKPIIKMNQNFALIYKEFFQLNENINKLKEKSSIKNLQEIKSYLSIGEYLDWLVLLILVSGIAFQLPLVITILAKVGVVDDRFLGKYRPHALVVILVAAAIITPPDIFSQMLIGLPVYILYEVSILLAKIIRKRNERSERELGKQAE